MPVGRLVQRRTVLVEEQTLRLASRMRAKGHVLLLAARQRLAQSLDHIERIYEPTKLDITRHPPQLGIVKHSALIRYSTLPEACQSTGTGTAAQTAHARLARVRHTRV